MLKEFGEILSEDIILIGKGGKSETAICVRIKGSIWNQDHSARCNYVCNNAFSDRLLFPLTNIITSKESNPKRDLKYTTTEI